MPIDGKDPNASWVKYRFKLQLQQYATSFRGAFYVVNTGSGNGLLPDGTKPLPEPMLTYHQ